MFLAHVLLYGVRNAGSVLDADTKCGLHLNQRPRIANEASTRHFGPRPRQPAAARNRSSTHTDFGAQRGHFWGPASMTLTSMGARGAVQSPPESFEGDKEQACPSIEFCRRPTLFLQPCASSQKLYGES